MKGIFVIMDGVADEPVQALGHVTPLQAAKTPNLDLLASEGQVDYCYTVKKGVTPESSTAILSLLGYDPQKVSRGVLEAIGAGVNLTRGDLALRTNFATVEDASTRNVMDRRAGRTLSTKEAQVLANAINTQVKLPFQFEFVPTIQHRGVLVIRGGFSDNISDIDPHYEGGFVSSKKSMKVRFSKPLDDEEDSKLASELVNKFVRLSHDVLDEQHLNKVRAKKGLYSANFLMCRGAGVTPANYRKLRGKWMALAYSPLETGIAKAAKMDIMQFSYPALKGIDVYSNLNTGLKKAIKNAVKMVKKYSKKYDYFFIHLKETDIPGHDNKPQEKVNMIELIDRRLFSVLGKLCEKNNAKLLVTGDHTTSCRQKSHTEHPVPVLYYDGANKKEKQVRRFTEEEGLKGKKMMGMKLLESTLFSKKK